METPIQILSNIFLC